VSSCVARRTDSTNSSCKGPTPAARDTPKDPKGRDFGVSLIFKYGRFGRENQMEMNNERTIYSLLMKHSGFDLDILK
jgi:hypothetical protein